MVKEQLWALMSLIKFVLMKTVKLEMDVWKTISSRQSSGNISFKDFLVLDLLGFHPKALVLSSLFLPYMSKELSRKICFLYSLILMVLQKCKLVDITWISMLKHISNGMMLCLTFGVFQ